jgi:hypothetical protein
MSLIVPLQPVPSQTTQVVLTGQSCQLNVYQAPTALFMDVYANDEPIRVGMICQNLNRIVRRIYLGFVGDFIFVDTQGTADPVYTGLGSRFYLIYLTAIEAGDT